jgi:hypothetical protein
LIAQQQEAYKGRDEGDDNDAATEHKKRKAAAIEEVRSLPQFALF